MHGHGTCPQWEDLFLKDFLHVLNAILGPALDLPHTYHLRRFQGISKSEPAPPDASSNHAPAAPALIHDALSVHCTQQIYSTGRHLTPHAPHARFTQHSPPAAPARVAPDARRARAAPVVYRLFSAARFALPVAPRPPPAHCCALRTARRSPPLTAHFPPATCRSLHAITVLPLMNVPLVCKAHD
ncbi:hypothetical protein GGX14DRAFT_565858 [Mycena pura]|uniref:Uncharacterized protein n=1 Tax=Mycena pura TaxID=153505 RepID=A0AAD6YHC2_9AGAR|nr:hypothetical protein GGX14DRAFT_565858 [Mycena pura]